MPDLQPGSPWGGFVIDRLVGRGPNGAVYRAARTGDPRPITLKVFDATIDAATLGRFSDDTRRVIGLGHPQVLKVETVGREGDLVFVVSEWFDGRPLSGPRSTRDAARLLLQAARGLGGAWMRLILHRNLKPENILVSAAGDVKITDFGQYREATRWWSPERVKGQTPDFRGEIYSLGAIFKEIVPAGDRDLDALLAHMTRVETFDRVQMVEDVISRLETWTSRNPADAAPSAPKIEAPLPPSAYQPYVPPPPTAYQPYVPPPAPVYQPFVPAPPPRMDPPKSWEMPDRALREARASLVNVLAEVTRRITKTLGHQHHRPEPPPLPPPPVYVPPPPPRYVEPPPPPPPARPVPRPPPSSPKTVPVEVGAPPPPPPRRKGAGAGRVISILFFMVAIGVSFYLRVYKSQQQRRSLEQAEQLRRDGQDGQARRQIEERIRKEKASNSERELLERIKHDEWTASRAKAKKLDEEMKYAEALAECEKSIAGGDKTAETAELRRSLMTWIATTGQAERLWKAGADRRAVETLARDGDGRKKEAARIIARWADEDWVKTKAAADKAAAEPDPWTAMNELDRFLKRAHAGGSHAKEAETRKLAYQADLEFSDVESRAESLARNRKIPEAIAAWEAYLAKPHQGGARREDAGKRIAAFKAEVQQSVFTSRNPVTRLAASPDAKRIAFTSDGLHVVDLATREELALLPQRSLLKSLAYGADGQLILGQSYKIWTIDVAKKTEGRSLTLTGGYLVGMALTPDSKKVVAVLSDGSLATWDPASDEPARIEKDLAAGALFMALSPDGKQFAIGGRDKSLRVRDLAGGEEKRWAGPTAVLSSLGWSPDGKLLLAGCVNGAVTLWNAESGDAGPELKGHTGTVSCVTFSADGAIAASGGADGLVRYSSTKDGAPLRILYGHRDRVTMIAFMPDGGLLSSSADGSVRVWPKE